MAEQLGVPVKLDIAPGVYTDETDSGAMGTWKDCDLIRFKNGLVQSLGGWKKKTLTGSSILGAPRSVHDWSALDTTKYMALGTEKRLYVIEASLLVTNITPIRKTASPTNPFDTDTAGGIDPVGTDAKFFRFNDTAHGSILGDIVEFDSYTSPVGGITVNGSFEVVSVESANAIILKAAAVATSTVTGGGSTGNVTYEITTGTGASGFVVGYGTGIYGNETYGEPRTVSTFTTEARVWSLDNWGEDLIASPRGGKIYVWDKSVGLGTRATVISVNAPITNLFVMVSSENRQIISLGAHNGTDDDPLFIAWCDNEDFTTWTPASNNNAGTKRLDSGSTIVTGIQTRVGILILTDTSVHIMQPLSGAEVFSFREIGTGISIAGPSAGVDANGIVYFMGLSNFYIYDGVLRVLPCPNWTKVYQDFNIFQGFSTFCSHSKNFNEVWWFYPSASKFNNDKYMVYNYVEQIWYFGEIDRASFHDYSPFFRLPYGWDSSGSLFTHEDGEDNDNVAMQSFIESGDMSIQDADQVMHVSKLIPDFDRITGSVDVLLKGRKQPQRTQFTKGPYTATGVTSEMGVRIRARYLAMRITQEGLGQSFRMGSWRARMRQDGER